MKDFIPSEEDFELLLTALGSYEKEQTTALVVEQYLKQMEGLNNEEAFVKAFSKDKGAALESEVVPKVKAVRDKVVLLFAKVIQFRDYVREHRLNGAIEDLIK